MGPTYIVVARHRDGSVTITKYTREDEAREAFDIVATAPSATDCYMAGVVREAHVRPEGVTRG